MRKTTGIARIFRFAKYGFVIPFCMLLTFCSVSVENTEPVTGISPGESMPRVRQYNVLGRTGLKVSDIGFGAGGTTDPAVVQYALEAGINFFDTSEAYGNGKSEETIGRVAALHRDKMIICTKLIMDGNTTSEDVFQKYEACLKRLQTNWCDILMIHGGNSDAVNNPEIHAAFNQLKKEGKIKYTGLSSHGPHLVEQLQPVVEENKFDVFLVAYDPVGEPELPALLKAANAKGIGIVAMKVFQSAKKTKLDEFISGDFPFQIAALRWVLRDSLVHTSIISINLMDQVDEYIVASGTGKNP